MPVKRKLSWMPLLRGGFLLVLGTGTLIYWLFQRDVLAGQAVLVSGQPLVRADYFSLGLAVFLLAGGAFMCWLGYLHSDKVVGDDKWDRLL